MDGGSPRGMSRGQGQQQQAQSGQSGSQQQQQQQSSGQECMNQQSMSDSEGMMKSSQASGDNVASGSYSINGLLGLSQKSLSGSSSKRRKIKEDPGWFAIKVAIKDNFLKFSFVRTDLKSNILGCIKRDKVLNPHGWQSVSFGIFRKDIAKLTSTLILTGNQRHARNGSRWRTGQGK